jgi:hypothetical protein
MLDRGNNSREPEFDSGVSEPNNEHTHFESSIEIAENEKSPGPRDNKASGI